MTSICLSLAPILRCISLDISQDIVLFIPAALQGLMVIGLMIFKRSRINREHYWLVSENLTFSILALLDLLSHVLTVARSNLKTFKTIDIFIASTSFIPLMLHIIYLFQLSQFNLPASRMVRRTVLSACILLLIALIVVNELNSFLGISYSRVNSRLGIELSNFDGRNLSPVFADVALALLIFCESNSFAIVLYGLFKEIEKRRMPEPSSQEIMDRGLVNRLIWIVVGIAFGCVEVLIGFAAIDFSGALVRRIVKFLGRFCLTLGAAIEVDTLGPFALLDTSILGRQEPTRRLELRDLISNPRLSTFIHLDPDASVPYSRTQGDFNISKTTSTEAIEYGDTRRVTLHYDGQSAPRLDVRLSGALIMNVSVPVLHKKNGNAESSNTGRATFTRKSLPVVQMPVINTIVSSKATSSPIKNSASYKTGSSSRESRFSFQRRNSNIDVQRSSSYNSNSPTNTNDTNGPRMYDSLDRIHEIALQFPGPPATPMEGDPNYHMNRISEEQYIEGDSVNVSTNNDTKSRLLDLENFHNNIRYSTMPPIPEDATTAQNTYDVDDRSRYHVSPLSNSLPPTTTPDLTMTALTPASSSFQRSEVLDDQASIDVQGLSGIAVRVEQLDQTDSIQFPRSPNVSDYVRYVQSDTAIASSHRGSRRRNSSSRSMDVPWLLQENEIDEMADVERVNLDEAWRTAGIGEIRKIKGFGTVARRQTPTPTQTPTRNSVTLDKLQFIPPATPNFSLSAYDEPSPERVSFEERLSEADVSDVGVYAKERRNGETD